MEKLTVAAKDAIEASTLLISPMAYLEFAYLYLYATLSTSFGVSLCRQAFTAIAAAAIELEGRMIRLTASFWRSRNAIRIRGW